MPSMTNMESSNEDSTPISFPTVASPSHQSQYAADLESVQAARERISPFAMFTPIMTCSSIDKEAGSNFFFKCEQFQKGGAFKFRGACNAVQSLTEDEARRGVVTHSSGNHAAALALAAKLRGITAHLVMPRITPQCKIDNVLRYGGKAYFCDNNVQAREETAARIQQETAAVLIPPYNDGRVISGQGTMALEFLEQVPQLDAIFVPISGGGMISGVAVAAKGIKPGIKIFAAEPKGADDAAESKRQGQLIKCSNPQTMADGLRASMGSLTWPIVRDLVDAVITVEEPEIIHAMRMCYERLKVVVEPSGAVGLAAALSPQFRSHPLAGGCENIGIILCGGNIDLSVLWQALLKEWC